MHKVKEKYLNPKGLKRDMGYFDVDWGDKWNWIGLILAGVLFWWGITNIIKALQYYHGA